MVRKLTLPIILQGFDWNRHYLLQAREAIWPVFVTVPVQNERSHQIWCIGGVFRAMSVIDSRIFAY